MTKKEYIKKYPKSMLADRLRNNDWGDDTEIEIIHGFASPNNKRSNLYKSLQSSKLKEYEVGARYGRTHPKCRLIAVA